MPHKKDYIPQGDAEYDIFFKNICQYVNQKCTGTPPEWTHIPAEARTELNAAYAAWYTAYSLTLKPHTPEDTAEKNRIKRSSKKMLRGFVKAYLRYFPAVTNADRDNMGVPNDDPVRTPIGVPKTRPEFNIVVKDIRTLSIPFHDQDTESRAIPYGLDGAVVRWVVQDKPATSFKELMANSALATRSPHTLVFTDEERGKTVSIALTWQNEKGDEGKPSEIQSAIVP
jgi:hypothetical protein